MSEKIEHKQVCDYLKTQYPKVIFNTDASGIKLTIGQAVQMKKLRSCNGFPDIMILEPRNSYHGLFVEMKKTGERIFKKDGTPATPHIAEQLELIEKLNSRGYYAVFCVGFEHAKKTIDEYLKT